MENLVRSIKITELIYFLQKGETRSEKDVRFGEAFVTGNITRCRALLGQEE